MVTHKQAEDRVNAGFGIHLASYVAVVTTLTVLNYRRDPENLWVFWVAGGAGTQESAVPTSMRCTMRVASSPCWSREALGYKLVQDGIELVILLKKSEMPGW